jgi:hypothetical protein
VFAKVFWQLRFLPGYQSTVDIDERGFWRDRRMVEPGLGRAIQDRE